MRLKGKTALVSGAGRNNGRAIALAYAREGADVILVSRKREEELREVNRQCEQFGVKTFAVLGDVSKPDDAGQVVRQGLDRFGKIDVLINVVGMRQHRPLQEVTIDEWHQMFAVNLFSMFYLARAVVPSMMERKSGNLIALGGLISLLPHTNSTALVSSKHGLHGLIKSLALDLGPHGIRANLIALSNIDSERRNPEWYSGLPKRSVGTPLGRKGTHDEVANVAVFLASDESSYVTGDRICCAGGRYM